MTYKQWVNGDILQAADQNALSLQTINRFADATARDAAISSPTEGMFVYLTGTNALQFYDGSSWTATSLTADITAIVTAASSGLAGGATSGDVTLTLNLAGVTAAQTFGADGSGVDVTFYSSTAGDTMLWDASEEKLVITGTNGQNSLEVADGDVSITDSLTVSGGLIAPLAINAQTGTTYTFVAADAGKLVTSSNGSAQTITIPPNSSVAFATGTQIIVQNIGSANATLAQG